MVPALLRLHDYGLFTTQSQPYTHMGPDYARCHCCTDYAWYITVQRPYISFLMPQKEDYMFDSAGSKMIDVLMEDDRIFTAVYNGEKGSDNFPLQQAKWDTRFTKMVRIAESGWP